MDILNSFQKEIDNSNFDYSNQTQIKDNLQKILEGLSDKDNNDPEKRLIMCEYEVLSVNVSVERGIETVWENQTKNEAGELVRTIWPDLSRYSDIELDYILKRYISTKNLYLKCKYGLVLFVLKKKADNEIVKELIDSFYDLSQHYLKMALTYHQHFILYFSHALKNAFYLAQKRKVSDKYKAIIEYIYNTFLGLSRDNEEGNFINSVLAHIMKENFKDFSNHVDLSKILELNWNLSNELVSKDPERAVEILEKTLKLASLLNDDIKKWNKLIGDCYASLGAGRKDMGAPSFYVKAIRAYKLSGNIELVKEIHALLTKSKTELNFGKMEYQLPTNQTKQINEDIKNEIANSDSDTLIKRLAQGVILPNFSTVKHNEIEKGTFSTSRIIPTEIYDKHGNKNITVKPQNANDDVSFYPLYHLSFQIPSQIYLKYFIDSIKSGKLNYDSLKNWFIKNSWYGEDIIRVYNGFTRNITILELIEPPLKLMFDEFQKVLGGATDRNYVCVLDSLTLKVEYIIRILFQEKLNIPTSYINADETVDEKTFTALIHDLKEYVQENEHIKPEMKTVLLDDFIFIDYTLNSKAGRNIRNIVAHGHLDLDEYSELKIVLVLAVILKISLFRVDPAIK